MATITRLTQDVVEAFAGYEDPVVRESQKVVEAFHTGNPVVRLTQAGLDVFISGSPLTRLAQKVVEVWYLPGGALPVLSGSIWGLLRFDLKMRAEERA